MVIPIAAAWFHAAPAHADGGTAAARAPELEATADPFAPEPEPEPAEPPPPVVEVEVPPAPAEPQGDPLGGTRDPATPEEIVIIQLVGIHRLPPSAYPRHTVRGKRAVRGLHGSSMWFQMHGQQWPYMPRTGIGISGYTWVNTGYEKIDRTDPTQQDIKFWLMEGRFVLRVTPTYTRNHFYVQGQAELVANNNQSVGQPSLVDTDDLWIRLGMWGRKYHNWNIQFGRYEAWELFHLGLGLDLFTLERRGAFDSNIAVPEIYGVTFTHYRPSGVGNLAFHYYPTEYLRIEALAQYGNNAGLNTVAGRGAFIFDWGWVKIKGGGEYLNQEAQTSSSSERRKRRGAGGAIQFVVDPYIEFGANGGWGITDHWDVNGNYDTPGSTDTWTSGGFVTARLSTARYLEDLLIGGGVQYTYTKDVQVDMFNQIGRFSHLQAFGAVQYFLFQNLQIRAVGAFARADLDPSFTTNPPYQNEMVSGRVQITRYF